MRQTGKARRTSWRSTVALGLGATILWLPACNSTLTRGEGADGRPTASAVRDPVLQDIPKPAGFRLAADRSMVTNIGRIRLAQCEYVGSGDPVEIKRFYEEYLPAAGFELRHWGLDHGEYDLDFESGQETCHVRIRPKGLGKTTVVVKVQPRAQGSLDRASGPPARRPD